MTTSEVAAYNRDLAARTTEASRLAWEESLAEQKPQRAIEALLKFGFLELVNLTANPRGCSRQPGRHTARERQARYNVERAGAGSTPATGTTITVHDE